MKRLIVLIALVVFPLSMLFAHPASELTVKYPYNEYVLSIEGKHLVSTSQNKDTKQHFIKTISISINGGTPKVKNFTSQTKNTFTDGYKLKLKNGDKIVVTATCSLGGEKTTEIVVEGRRE